MIVAIVWLYFNSSATGFYLAVLSFVDEKKARAFNQ
jgi:hypothetical protein